MSSKHGMFFFLLLFVVVLVGLKNGEGWTNPLEITKKNRPLQTPGATRKIPPLLTGTDHEPHSVGWIAEKNIFSPERKAFSAPARTQPIPPAPPQIILYGVTISETYQSATVANPGRLLRKGERETFSLKIGDQVGGYKLTNISPDRITMEAAGSSFEVLLYDPRTAKKRSETMLRAETSPPAPPISSQEKTEEVKETVKETMTALPSEPSGPPRPSFPSALNRRRGLYAKPSGS